MKDELFRELEESVRQGGNILRERAPGRVQTGEFGAMMAVELVNDGPVTLVLERE